MKVFYMNLDKLGLQIKNGRRLLKMTQEQLAELIDVSPHYIYEIEKGLKTPSLPVLIAISENLHISVSMLLSENTQATDKGGDELDRLTENLSSEQRANLAKVIRSLYPWLRL